MYSSDVEVNLQKFIDSGLNEAVNRAMKQVAEIVEEDAKKMCPVRTGALQESIHADVIETTVELTADADYAQYVELGTYKMAAQPFIRPAIEKNKSKIERQFEGIL